jgi:hypothetical protein
MHRRTAKQGPRTGEILGATPAIRTAKRLEISTESDQSDRPTSLTKSDPPSLGRTPVLIVNMKPQSLRTFQDSEICMSCDERAGYRNFFPTPHHLQPVVWQTPRGAAGRLYSANTSARCAIR